MKNDWPHLSFVYNRTFQEYKTCYNEHILLKGVVTEITGIILGVLGKL